MKKAVLVAIGILFAAYLVARHVPIEPRNGYPGTGLGGPLAASQDTDRSFRSTRPSRVLIETATWYGIPHSVTVTSWVQDGALYVRCSRCDTKRWSQNLTRNADVRLKIEGEIYERRAVPIKGWDERRRLLMGRETGSHRAGVNTQLMDDLTTGRTSILQVMLRDTAFMEVVLDAYSATDRESMSMRKFLEVTGTPRASISNTKDNARALDAWFNKTLGGHHLQQGDREYVNQYFLPVVLAAGVIPETAARILYNMARGPNSEFAWEVFSILQQKIPAAFFYHGLLKTTEFSQDLAAYRVSRNPAPHLWVFRMDQR